MQLPPSEGNNIHVIGGVVPGSGLLLLKTRDGSIQQKQNARFIVDLFAAVMRTSEYRALAQEKMVVIVTDNAPAHSSVEDLTREQLTADGIMNGNRLATLRLGSYSPMLNPTEGCWNLLKARMREFMAVKKNKFLVRGEFNTYTAHRLDLMKEAMDTSKHVITTQLVRREECHCMRACFAAERGEGTQLGT